MASKVKRSLLARAARSVKTHKVHWFLNSAIWGGDGQFRCIICNKPMPKGRNNPFQKVSLAEKLKIARAVKKGETEGKDAPAISRRSPKLSSRTPRITPKVGRLK